MGAVKLFVNATVLTMDPSFPRAEALAIRDGRIAAVGSSDEVLWLRDGEIGRDKAGEPTGLLFERAMGRVEQASREGWEPRFSGVVAAASRRYAACGITTVQDAAVSPEMERRYGDGEGADQLKIRVSRLAVGLAGWFDPPWDLARTRCEGGALKVFADGGYRCAMRVPRDGREVTSGFLFFSQAELADLLVEAWRSGWSMVCHAIRNLGVEVALDAVEAALGREPTGEGRVRIDHAMFLTRELIARIRALGIPVVSQPCFVYDLGAPRVTLPPEILCRPFRSLLEAGKRADLIVLDSNPLEVPPETLLGVSVLRTYMAGQEVWP